MIQSALLCLIVSGCADQQPAGLRLARVEPVYAVPFDKFFLAWSEQYSSGPIQAQTFWIDTRQARQVARWPADPRVLAFASANPGQLYVVGDEPDQGCMLPSDYAGIYHDVVAALRGADSTARFSPAGFAEPNYYCCPPPADAACKARMHSISYADRFYTAYVQRYGLAPPVAEWRFHDFGISFEIGDMDGWWSRVDSEAAWSVSHGANMVLGAWGFLGWREPVPARQEHMKQGIGRILNDKRILGAIYWSREPWVDSPFPLVNEDGSLTPDGQAYSNPLTDIPSGAKIVGSGDGHAKLRWSNTTSAWAAEAEFWVQAPGSNSFVYKKTLPVARLGATQTPFDVFSVGDSVKGRVRYYNRYGQAAWSSFSNTVLMASSAPETNESGLPRKNPFSCLLEVCQ